MRVQTKNMVTTFTILLLLSLLTSPAQAQWSNLSLTLFAQPCRSVDTRHGDGPLQDNEIYVFSVEPIFSTLQGGSIGCGVPSNAAAVKLLVKGQSISFDGGWFKIFNASGSAIGVFTHLQLQNAGLFIGAEFDVPVDGNLQVAIHTLKSANAIVDIAGYYTSN